MPEGTQRPPYLIIIIVSTWWVGGPVTDIASYVSRYVTALGYVPTTDFDTELESESNPFQIRDAEKKEVTCGIRVLQLRQGLAPMKWGLSASRNAATSASTFIISTSKIHREGDMGSAMDLPDLQTRLCSLGGKDLVCCPNSV